MITGSKHNLASALEDLAFILNPTTHVLPSSHLCLLQVLVVLVIAISGADPGFQGEGGKVIGKGTPTPSEGVWGSTVSFPIGFGFSANSESLSLKQITSPLKYIDIQYQTGSNGSLCTGKGLHHDRWVWVHG